jgi:hypothetical protein
MRQANTKFTKFAESFQKQYKEQLELMESSDYRTLEMLDDLFLFLDSIIPPDDSCEDDGTPMRGVKRYRLDSLRPGQDIC